jgi:uncharacterized paraquat-inducible protein A
MPTVLCCPGCHATIRANDAAAGRSLPCPGCNTLITVPHAGSAEKLLYLCAALGMDLLLMEAMTGR